MDNSFRTDILMKEQIFHLLDRDWIKQQTGVTLRFRPESDHYQSAIEHFNGYSYSDVRLNQTRHPVKPVIKNIVDFYVKIISICLDKLGKPLTVDPELESKEFDPFNYLDERGFENYCIELLDWKIETPYLLKTMIEVMLNNPKNESIKDQLIYLYKRQGETPQPNSIELMELWNCFVERIIGSYDEIVRKYDAQVPEREGLIMACFDRKTLASLDLFDVLDNPIWSNILNYFDDVQRYNSRMKNDTNMLGRTWLRISWYHKGDIKTLSWP